MYVTMLSRITRPKQKAIALRPSADRASFGMSTGRWFKKKNWRSWRVRVAVCAAGET